MYFGGDSSMFIIIQVFNTKQAGSGNGCCHGAAELIKSLLKKTLVYVRDEKVISLAILSCLDAMNQGNESGGGGEHPTRSFHTCF